jgi:hypothetical protein
MYSLRHHAKRGSEPFTDLGGICGVSDVERRDVRFERLHKHPQVGNPPLPNALHVPALSPGRAASVLSGNFRARVAELPDRGHRRQQGREVGALVQDGWPAPTVPSSRVALRVAGIFALGDVM